MFCINDADKAKKSARALEKSVAKLGIKMPHGHALNTIAAMAGFPDWNAMRKSFTTPSATPATVVPAAVIDSFWTQPGQPELKRYRVEVFCESDSLGVQHYLALSDSAAEAMGMDALWDERVERSQAQVECEEVEYDDDGPFSVFSNGEWRAEADTFAAAYRKAMVWHSVNPGFSITVRDGAGDVLTNVNG